MMMNVFESLKSLTKKVGFNERNPLKSYERYREVGNLSFVDLGAPVCGGTETLFPNPSLHDIRHVMSGRPSQVNRGESDRYRFGEMEMVQKLDEGEFVEKYMKSTKLVENGKFDFRDVQLLMHNGLSHSLIVNEYAGLLHEPLYVTGFYLTNEEYKERFGESIWHSVGKNGGFELAYRRLVDMYGNSPGLFDMYNGVPNPSETQIMNQMGNVIMTSAMVAYAMNERVDSLQEGFNATPLSGIISVAYVADLLHSGLFEKAFDVSSSGEWDGDFNSFGEYVSGVGKNAKEINDLLVKMVVSLTKMEREKSKEFNVSSHEDSVLHTTLSGYINLANDLLMCRIAPETFAVTNKAMLDVTGMDKYGYLARMFNTTNRVNYMDRIRVGDKKVGIGLRTLNELLVDGDSLSLASHMQAAKSCNTAFDEAIQKILLHDEDLASELGGVERSEPQVFVDYDRLRKLELLFREWSKERNPKLVKFLREYEILLEETPDMVRASFFVPQIFLGKIIEEAMAREDIDVKGVFNRHGEQQANLEIIDLKQAGQVRDLWEKSCGGIGDPILSDILTMWCRKYPTEYPYAGFHLFGTGLSVANHSVVPQKVEMRLFPLELADVIHRSRIPYRWLGSRHVRVEDG